MTLIRDLRNFFRAIGDKIVSWCSLDEKPPAYQQLNDIYRDTELGIIPASNKTLEDEETSDEEFDINKLRPGGGYNVTLLFGDSKRPHHLVAALDLKVNDIPKLMREGLYINQSNVDVNKSYFTWPGEPLFWARLKDFKAGRIYELRESEDGQSNWSGSLRVYATEISELSRFRIDSHLILANCEEMIAWGRHGAVYYYDSTKPGRCFNAIYDNAPLEGLWPWPKKAQNE